MPPLHIVGLFVLVNGRREVITIGEEVGDTIELDYFRYDTTLRFNQSLGKAVSIRIPCSQYDDPLHEETVVYVIATVSFSREGKILLEATDMFPVTGIQENMGFGDVVSDASIPFVVGTGRVTCLINSVSDATLQLFEVAMFKSVEAGVEATTIR